MLHDVAENGPCVRGTVARNDTTSGQIGGERLLREMMMARSCELKIPRNTASF